MLWQRVAPVFPCPANLL